MMFLRRSKPNKETVCKIIYRARQRLHTELGRRWLKPQEAQLSDRAFVRSLDDQFQSVEKFLEYMRERVEPRFFIDSALHRDVASLARTYFPASVERAIAVADQVCAHIFDLLGSGPVHLGEQIDWHKDFKTGWQWEPTYYADIEYLDLDQPYDVKIPWELSRFHHAVTLGQAYWFTGDEKYAREFRAQVDDWLISNPPGFGVNWVCTMEVAIRVVNWIWGYHFFKDSLNLSPDFQLRFFKGLLAHGQYIFSNLEWGLTTHNHYLSNLVGLIYLGAMFPEFKQSDRWLRWGLEGLEREMEIQVHPDGVDYEASISYHRLVAELFLSAVLLCRRNNISVSDKILSRLEKMIEFVMTYTQPDGTVPLIGDADDGRLHKLTPPDRSREFIDHRHLLGVGAMLFDRADFAQSAGDAWEDAFWLSGGKALPPARDSVPALASRAFRDGGVYVQRRADLHLTIDAGDNGSNGIGGHGHNDALSLTLYAYDRTFLVDPGSYVYTADYQWRNHFRSTAAHNTVIVDDQEMQRFGERQLFQLEEDARPQVLAWQTAPEFDLFDGVHYGYGRLSEPVSHRRQVYFDKRDGLWVVRDLLTGRGQHAFALYFHFAPLPVSVWPDADSLAVRTFCPDGANLAVVPLTTDDLSIRVFKDWVSPSYGRKLPAPVVCFSKKEAVPAEFITALFPLPAGVEKTLEEIRELAFHAWKNPPLGEGMC
jgi:hypothetical protein